MFYCVAKESYVLLPEEVCTYQNVAIQSPLKLTLSYFFEEDGFTLMALQLRTNFVFFS